MNKLNYLVVDLPEDINRTIMFGDFKSANRLIDIYLNRNISKMLKERLLFEKHRITLLEKEYIYSYEDAFKMLSDKIDGFKKDDLDYLKDERYAEWIYINGEIKFHSSFFDNVMKVYYSNVGEHDATGVKNILDEVVDQMMLNGEMKYFTHVKTGIKLNKENINNNKNATIHLTIPQEALQIKNIKILATSHKPKQIAPLEYGQRTICFEEEVKGSETFTVEYSYENHAKYTEIDYNNVSEIQPKFYTEEWLPHIRFTPFLVDLAKEIIEDEINPLKKARKIYDYITTNVQYSYMRSYSAIVNIPEYAAYNLKGDCGVQALLFITLCRIVGVPARWQSGLYIKPDSIGCHDWTQFYIEPYGWLFADLSFGGSAYRTKNMKRWNFYFGNLDPFRMVANSHYQYPFLPKKKYLRKDPYDNQIGEVEYDDNGLYNGEFKVIKEIVDIHQI